MFVWFVAENMAWSKHLEQNCQQPDRSLGHPRGHLTPSFLLLAPAPLCPTASLAQRAKPCRSRCLQSGPPPMRDERRWANTQLFVPQEDNSKVPSTRLYEGPPQDSTPIPAAASVVMLPGWLPPFPASFPHSSPGAS